MQLMVSPRKGEHCKHHIIHKVGKVWRDFSFSYLQYLSSFVNICEFKGYLKAIRCSNVGVCYVAYMYLEYHLST